MHLLIGLKKKVEQPPQDYLAMHSHGRVNRVTTVVLNTALATHDPPGEG